MYGYSTSDERFEPLSLRRRRQTTDGPYYRRRAVPPHRQRARGQHRLSIQQQLTLCAAALATLAVWYLSPVSVYITDIVLEQIPVSADIELGQQAVAEFSYPTVYQARWTPLVRQVGNELVLTRQKQHGQHNPQDYLYQWDFGVVHTPSVNAFALPGGVVRVTDALLELLKPTTGELAALLGHEMGHVVSRHSQARMIQQQLLQYLFQALLYEDGDDDRETFGQAVGELLTKSAAWLGQQRFSRRDEYQADAVSWELLVDDSNAYNPQSLHSILTKLWSLEQDANRSHKDKDSKSSSTWDRDLLASVSAWSRTHPATEDRLAALDDKWNQLSSKERRRLSRNQI
jgi:Zn-dependent protease with chaperone function